MGMSPSQWSSLRNQSLSHLLTRPGSCLADVKWQCNTKGQITSITSHRRFDTDDVVQMVPIHIVPRWQIIASSGSSSSDLEVQDDKFTDNQAERKGAPPIPDGDSNQKQCGTRYNRNMSQAYLQSPLMEHCWVTSNSWVALCPLSGFVPISSSTTSTTTKTPMATTTTSGNVAITWALWDDHHQHEYNNLDTMTVERISRLSPGFIFLKVVATRAIEVGDEVREGEKREKKFIT